MSSLLKVSDLTISFETEQGSREVVSHSSFQVKEGEVVCLVGESGCGKSVTALSLMQLLGSGGKIVQGSICFEGKDLLGCSEKELDEIRGNEISMIFQDPMSSLNPTFTVGYQVMESLRTHTGCSKREAKEKAMALLQKVGLKDSEKLFDKYPHTLSGGMRQRVMIAMALACNPKLLIADEPTTALDASVQAQILELLKELQQESHMAMLLITHDMGIVSHMASRVLVMYAGEIVEEADVSELFRNPSHPYTKALLGTIPTTKDTKDRVLTAIPGMVPENYDTITGCRFAERCAFASETCKRNVPIKEVAPHHTIKCIL